MKRARPLLGTVVEITAEGAVHSLPAAIEAAFASVERVQQLMSFHEPNSDVSRINGAATGREVRIDRRTFTVLQFARRLSDLSEGAFDITTASVLVENRFLPKRSRETIPLGATFHDLDLLRGNRVRWHRKGWIDLGGVAKGYAVDCAIAMLRARGVKTGIVNAGGDLRCFGEAQPVHIRHPNAPTLALYLGRLADAALASSAGYFSGVRSGSRRIDPLVDPKHSRCTSWSASISVAAPDGIAADALTKVVRLRPDLAPGILERFGAQAIVIDHRGTRCCGRPLLQLDIGKCGRTFNDRRCA
jgi:FAD:protein FMN transferase